MATLREFSARMDELGILVEELGPRIARRAALAVDQAVVLATPVDTGAARANWQGALNGPVRRAIPPYAAGTGGSSGAANAQAAIDQASQVIDEFEGDGEIYLSNPLPYIGRLNEGSSAQAPAQFVESAIQIGVDVVRQGRVLRDNG